MGNFATKSSNQSKRLRKTGNSSKIATNLDVTPKVLFGTGVTDEHIIQIHELPEGLLGTADIDEHITRMHELPEGLHGTFDIDEHTTKIHELPENLIMRSNAETCLRYNYSVSDTIKYFMKRHELPPRWIFHDILRKNHEDLFELSEIPQDIYPDGYEIIPHETPYWNEAIVIDKEKECEIFWLDFCNFRLDVVACQIKEYYRKNYGYTPKITWKHIMEFSNLFTIEDVLGQVYNIPVKKGKKTKCCICGEETRGVYTNCEHEHIYCVECFYKIYCVPIYNKYEKTGYACCRCKVDDKFRGIVIYEQ
jgi:hypothetical protein